MELEDELKVRVRAASGPSLVLLLLLGSALLLLLLQVLGDLRADNQRLKDENAALIRVISKLSR